MATALLGACAEDERETSTQVCKDEQGRRADDAACETRRAGHGFVFIPGMMRTPARGEVISGYTTTPGTGTVRSAEGRVVRGGFGMSAHGSAAT